MQVACYSTCEDPQRLVDHTAAERCQEEVQEGLAFRWQVRSAGPFGTVHRRKEQDY